MDIFLQAMAGGVFYREFTKYFDFTGKTTLAYLHVHLLVLGTLLFLFLGLAAKSTDLLEKKQFRTFVTLYNIVLPLFAVVMLCRYHSDGRYFIVSCSRCSDCRNRRFDAYCAGSSMDFPFYDFTKIEIEKDESGNQNMVIAFFMSVYSRSEKM